MTKRKSFVVHLDSLDVLDDLSDEQAGRLLKAMKAYNLGEEIELDQLTKIAFAPFKAQFRRDNDKYQAVISRNQENGKKGGRPKKNPENPVGFSETQQNPTKPKKADSDSDSDSDSDNKKEKKEKAPSPCVTEIFDHWVSVMNKNPSQVRLNDKRKRLIKSRLNEDWSVEDLKRAIDGCKASDFHQGREPGKPTVHDNIDLIMRDASHVETFIALAAPKTRAWGDLEGINYDVPCDY